MKKVLYSFIAIGLLFTNVYAVRAALETEQNCVDGVCIENYDELSDINTSTDNQSGSSNSTYTSNIDNQYTTEMCMRSCMQGNGRDPSYCENACEVAKSCVFRCSSAGAKVDNCINTCEKDAFNEDTVSIYTKIVCGDIKIPYAIPQMVRTIIIILQIATPIIIIILGSVDLLKAVMAQKEDEIKKGQQVFIRRLIVGSLVFLVFVLTELVIGLVAPKNDNQNMWNCVDCFVNGKCANVIK